MRILQIGAASLAFACLLCAAETSETLKDAYKDSFVIGAAINRFQITGVDALGDATLVKQFNSISPENDLKWERIHPQPGVYNFDLADKYVALGEKNKMYIVGHTLVWHNQTPQWVFRDDKGEFVSREVLLQRLKDHIFTVVGRYKGRIKSWDVVNEALNEDGTLRQSPWLKIIGEDYIQKAFEYAHEADPQALLTYNDYTLENEAKRNGAIALVKKLKAAGVPIAIVGIQGHDKLKWPTLQQEEETIKAFADLGVKVAITELDIDVLPEAENQYTAEVTLTVKEDPKLNPYTKGLPEEKQKELAARYKDLFAIYWKYRASIARVTFWGIADSDSWLNNWPIRGRTSYPLLFDKEGKPKPAFDAVLHVPTTDNTK